jgi:hypothetical protein
MKIMNTLPEYPVAEGIIALIALFFSSFVKNPALVNMVIGLFIIAHLREIKERLNAN